MTLVEGMQDFRRTWDAHVYKTSMKRALDWCRSARSPRPSPRRCC